MSQQTPSTFSMGPIRGRGQLRGQGHGGRFNRGSMKQLGNSDPDCMDSAPLNNFENQVIHTGLRDISKRFRPNLATTRVFTHFVPPRIPKLIIFFLEDGDSGKYIFTFISISTFILQPSTCCLSAWLPFFPLGVS